MFTYQTYSGGSRGGDEGGYRHKKEPKSQFNAKELFKTHYTPNRPDWEKPRSSEDRKSDLGRARRSRSRSREAKERKDEWGGS